MAHTNQEGSLLLNTSNKSESALGYMTIYGDLCGAIGVLLDVVKTKVYALARYINRDVEVIPKAILERTPTAELKLNQTDFETLPPFEILDPIIELYLEKRLTIDAIALELGQAPQFVQAIVHQIHLAEYKRRQAPIAIRVSVKSFSKGRNVPIVQLWK